MQQQHINTWQQARARADSMRMFVWRPRGCAVLRAAAAHNHSQAAAACHAEPPLCMPPTTRTPVGELRSHKLRWGVGAGHFTGGNVDCTPPGLEPTVKAVVGHDGLHSISCPRSRRGKGVERNTPTAGHAANLAFPAS